MGKRGNSNNIWGKPCWVFATLFFVAVVQAVDPLPTLAKQNSNERGDQFTNRNENSKVVVLKSGGCLTGQLEISRGAYVVRNDNGSSITVNRDNVDFIAESLEDAYQKLFDRLDLDDFDGQRQLARWCLKYRHFQGAKTQLALLSSLDGDSMVNASLFRQLRELENHVADAQTNRHAALPRRLPVNQKRLASHQELQQTVDSFDESFLREFNRSIHLRMVNGCSAASCHGNPDRAMRLWRVDNRGGIASTGMRRNLHAISKFLNRNSPENSQLLEYASTIHGGMDAPAYETSSHDYHAIRQWVLSLNHRVDVVQGRNDATISQTGFLSDSGAQIVNPENNPVADPAIPNPVNLAEQETRFTPKDEFDPAIFNRKYKLTSPNSNRSEFAVGSLKPENRQTVASPERQPSSDHQGLETAKPGLRRLPPPEDELPPPGNGENQRK